jgi:hypothetical protein
MPVGRSTLASYRVVLLARSATARRDLPDLAMLEDAGLLGKAQLIRGALGIKDDDQAKVAPRSMRTKRRICGAECVAEARSDSFTVRHGFGSRRCASSGVSPGERRGRLGAAWSQRLIRRTA